MKNPFIFWGAVNAAIAVGMGAFGAHGLREVLEPRMLEVFNTAADYQLWHALGLIAIGLAGASLGGRLPRIAGWLMFAGILLFSGSLYAMVLSGERMLGIITPFGGTAFIAAWVLLAIAASQGRRSA